MGDTSTRYKRIAQITLVILILSLGCNGIGGAYLWRMSQATPIGVEVDSVAVQEDNVQGEEVSQEEYAQAYYAKQLQDLLTPEELVYVTQRQWEYVLSANGHPFTGATIALENSHNVRIMVAEVLKDSKSLPVELLKLGSIGQSDAADALTDHVDVYTTVPYEITMEESEGSIKYYYDFKDVPKGTVIGLQVSEILKERLACKEQISENRLQVIVR